MIPLEIDTIRDWHRDRNGVCVHCSSKYVYQPWPCDTAKLIAQLDELREAHRNESAGLDNWRNRAERAEAQRDTLVDLLTNTVAINVHAYATGKAHPLGRFENCTAEVCVEWQKVLGDIPGWAKARDALIAAEAVEGALSVERLIPAVKYAFEAAQEWRPDPTHSYMNQPVWPFDKFAVALRAALRAALLAEPTAPQKEEDR